VVSIYLAILAKAHVSGNKEMVDEKYRSWINNLWLLTGPMNKVSVIWVLRMLTQELCSVHEFLKTFSNDTDVT